MGKIPNDVLNILDRCTYKGNALFLPEHLDSAMYKAVNKIIEGVGGKWNRKLKSHIFDYDDVEELIENIILIGEAVNFKKQYQFFPTPQPIAEHMCDLAELNSNSFVMEPSVGEGHLADEIWKRDFKLFCGLELNTRMESLLTNKPYTVNFGIDFLSFEDDRWDRIIMNPPFSKQQDVEHIQKAFEILKPGGILVSVVGVSPFFRNNRKSLEFMEFLSENNAEIESLPAGAFAESGTNVETKIIKILKECA